MVKTIALIEAPGHVSARYRIAAFVPALRNVGCSLTFAVIPRSALNRLLLFSKLRAFDAVLLQRRLLPGYQLKYLRLNARRLIFDFDDLVFCHDSYDPRGIVSVQRERQFRMLMSAADEVIAGSSFLRESAVTNGAKENAVHVIPTSVDPSKYPPADHRSKEILDLVWIGSSSTLKGLERCRELFENLADRFSTIRLRLICDRFPDFTRPPIVSIPWNEATEAAELAAGDIGISCVPDDLWSKGKCGLKILQYYAASLPVIANSVGVHTEMIRSGITGMLADTDEQWLEAICLLSQPEVRRRMGKVAREYVQQQYSVDANRDKFVDLVAGTTFRKSSVLE
jgi:glycosyltransferase involved in cell wall biosynthesis